MKNKIIIWLMFVLVVALVIISWQTLSEENEKKLRKEDIESAQQQTVNTPNIKRHSEQGQQEERVQVSKTSDGQTQAVVEDIVEEAIQEKEITEPGLCDLVGTYDDWQKTSSGYNSQKLVDDVRGWGNTRGYFEMEYNGSRMEIKKTSDYDYYETDDLKQMADAGDPIANVKLAYRLFLEGDPGSLEEAQPYCERAIVDGYSAMHRCKVSFLHHLLANHENAEEPELERIEELHIEVQAWQKMYELRNDPLGELFTTPFASAVEGVEISDEEVEAEAQALYTDLIAQRNNLGLGAFNSEPAPDIIVYAVEHNIQEEAVAKCFE